MPAVIAIEGGSDNGRSFQIEEEVVRVGRGPLCQVVLTDPAAPEAALVVRYQNRGYVVYNRTGRSITVNGAPVEQGGTKPWLPGQKLQAWPGAVLKLVVTGDPAPARRQVGVSSTDLGTDRQPEPVKTAEEVAAAAAPPPAKGKKTIQYAVIGATWLALIGAVVYKAAGPDPAAQTEDKEYGEVIRELRARPNDPLAADVADKLRDARTAEERGHTTAARRLYGEVVIRLRNRPAADPKAGPDALDRALKFARTRASQLGSEE